MLERLADQIRPLVAWRRDPASSNPPPKGATGDGGFRVTPEMMSILGCSSADVGDVLQVLGFRRERVPLPQIEAAPAEASTHSAFAAETTGGAAASGAGVDGAADAGPRPSAESAPVPDGPGTEPVTESAQAESKWDEIWRPRRQGHQHDRPRRRHAAQAGNTKTEARPPPPRGKEVWRNRQRKHSAPAGHREGGRPYSQSAAPPPKAGIDPDSPFAALSSLKAALERRSQE